ncbi:hypothetical protein FOZ60_014345 [Perkinsus olseni]|uniref:Uncharacterized protein n=1 Tax=Perkinsus olseni TaxID=32597 RepID=A0A7J6P8J7_PEROL|nr:hypothetical protein FOZ60_014345 [Perkinsus olseni]
MLSAKSVGSAGRRRASHRSSPATEAALDELRKWGLSGTEEGLVDVGANIATLSDGLLVQQLRRSWAAGVKRIVVTGTSVALASELHMPLFLHERDRGRGGGTSGLRILSKHGIDPKLAVFHCFTGSRQVAQEYIQKGYWIGLTGTVAVAKALAELMNVSVEEVAERTTENVLKLFPKISQVGGDEHPSDDEGFW